MSSPAHTPRSPFSSPRPRTPTGCDGCRTPPGSPRAGASTPAGINSDPRASSTPSGCGTPAPACPRCGTDKSCRDPSPSRDWPKRRVSPRGPPPPPPRLFHPRGAARVWGRREARGARQRGFWGPRCRVWGRVWMAGAGGRPWRWADVGLGGASFVLVRRVTAAVVAAPSCVVVLFVCLLVVAEEVTSLAVSLSAFPRRVSPPHP
mmetsp:Transcript_9746/g.24505  ORF Transcript_9746/g.24505 Transcript_9746/m.24505 type:complete len:205 (+) Transcript_9746:1412-2026(+)